MDLTQIEREAEKTTLAEFPREVHLVIDGLNLMVDAFNTQGQYTNSEDEDPIMLLFGLCSRSFNTARSAYRELLASAYTQSIMLIRHMSEDWVTTHAVIFDEETRHKLWTKVRPKGAAAMAKAISPEVAALWESEYGINSEISHPQGLSLALQLHGDTIRFGPRYEARLAKYCFAHLMRALERMAIVLCRTVNVTGADSGSLITRANTYHEAVEAWHREQAVQAQNDVAGDLTDP